MYVLKQRTNIPVKVICPRIDVDILPSKHDGLYTAWIYLDEQLNHSVTGNSPFVAFKKAWEWVMDRYEMVEENDEIEVTIKGE